MNPYRIRIWTFPNLSYLYGKESPHLAVEQVPRLQDPNKWVMQATGDAKLPPFLQAWRVYNLAVIMSSYYLTGGEETTWLLCPIPWIKKELLLSC